MIKHKILFRNDFDRLQMIVIPENAVMAVLTIFGKYALITFYDLLERMICAIETIWEINQTEEK